MFPFVIDPFFTLAYCVLPVGLGATAGGVFSREGRRAAEATA